MTVNAKPAVSVISCTHNPRQDYFVRVLEALKRQSLPRSEWELVIVDNVSDEPLAQRYDVSWHGSARIVREETPGLTPARLRGIRETKGHLLVFVDDDNILADDYLETVLAIARSKPFLGSWSGQCFAEFDESPPEWTRRYWGNLVIREFEGEHWSNLARCTDTMPCGAGLCVRRSVAEHYLRLHDTGQRRFQLDRTGNSLVSGGDNDLAACACDVGLGVGLMSSLRLIHLMPSFRFTERYLARLVEGISFSDVIMTYMRNGATGTSVYRVRLKDRLRALALPAPHRAIALAALRGRQKGLRHIEEHAS